MKLLALVLVTMAGCADDPEPGVLDAQSCYPRVDFVSFAPFGASATNCALDIISDDVFSPRGSIRGNEDGTDILILIDKSGMVDRQGGAWRSASGWYARVSTLSTPTETVDGTLALVWTSDEFGNETQCRWIACASDERFPTGSSPAWAPFPWQP